MGNEIEEDKKKEEIYFILPGFEIDKNMDMSLIH
jgi:hypothetical protein